MRAGKIDAFELKPSDLLAHVSAISRDKDVLAGALDAAPAAGNVYGPDAAGRASALIVQHRRAAIEVAQAATVRAADNLLRDLEATRAAVAPCCWEADAVPQVPSECLLPVWFARFAGKGRWLPLVVASRVTDRPLTGKEDLTLGIDLEQNRSIRARLARACSEDAAQRTLDAAATRPDQTGTQRLLNQYQQWLRSHVISEPLYHLLVQDLEATP